MGCGCRGAVVVVSCRVVPALLFVSGPFTQEKILFPFSVNRGNVANIIIKRNTDNSAQGLFALALLFPLGLNADRIAQEKLDKFRLKHYGLNSCAPCHAEVMYKSIPYLTMYIC